MGNYGLWFAHEGNLLGLWAMASKVEDLLKMAGSHP